MAVLKAPFCRVSLWSGGTKADHVLLSGRDILTATVTLGEGDRASNCQITAIDPGLSIASYYQKLALDRGGFAVPTNVLSRSQTGADAQPSGGGLGDGPTNIEEGLRDDDLARAIVAYAKSKGITDPIHLAAILGTCQKESSMGVYTEEIDDGSNYSYLAPEQYWHGRGLVQVTWKSNYEKMSQRYGVDFIADPELMTQLRYAIPILVDGMWQGWFTSYALNDLENYVSRATPREYFTYTRLIVNPLEGGGELRTYVEFCLRWYTRLQSGRGIADVAALQTAENSGTVAIATSAVPEGAIEIQVELGWNFSDKVQSFAFWLTSARARNGPPGTVTFQGQSVRFALSRSERLSRVVQNTSLRMWAAHIQSITGTKIYVKPGLAADEVGNETQRRESDFQMLIRMATARGYMVKEEGDQIVVEPIKSGPRVSFDRAYGVKFEDSGASASSNRKLGELPDIDAIPDGSSIGTGFETTVSLPYPSVAALGLTPGRIIDLKPDVAPGAFARRYRLKTVRWTFGSQGLTGRCGLYLPVAIEKPPANSQGQTTTGSYGDLTKVPQVNKGQPYISVTATGGRVNFGGQPKEVELICHYHGPDGQVDQSKPAVICVSGQGWNQSLRDVNEAGSMAPCPPGTFRLGVPARASGSGVITATEQPPQDWRKSAGGIRVFSNTLGPYWIAVEGTPGRTQIGFHTDQNRATSPGTAGCFGVLRLKSVAVSGDVPAKATMYEAMFTVCQWVAGGADVVVVDYSNWPKL